MLRSAVTSHITSADVLVDRDGNPYHDAGGGRANSDVVLLWATE